jgi:5-methyltetrahydropteroyltriglutamate--homocysteine methyltransferase
MTILATNLGFPRIGSHRELKTATESYWAGKSPADALLKTAASLRARHWVVQQKAGIAHIPSNDFSLYDQMLDTIAMLGAVPPRYGHEGGSISLDLYFAMARGRQDAPAMEMTKWFDTNYHHLVPLLSAAQRFTLTENRPLTSLREAAAIRLRTRPVLLGPVSFLLLCKTTDGSDPLDLLGRLLPVYATILAELAQAGASWVQVDEPALALDLSPKAHTALSTAYAALVQGPAPEILLTSYFGPIGANLPTVMGLPVAGLHLDLARGSADLAPVLDGWAAERWLSLGVVDGRNVWRTDMRAALATLQQVATRRGTRRLMVAPSCSLLHVPVDLAQETRLDADLRSWLAFATQKLEEVAALARGLDEGETAISAELAASDAAKHARAASRKVHLAEVNERVAAIGDTMQCRAAPYPKRRAAQQARLQLPLFPTTTIGSFPQTPAVRQTRAALARQDISDTDYETSIKSWIDETIRWQEEIGLDVLVHGEFERNDMVKYFGERLSGYAFTQHGWVQSYGSRCVAPPIIWGDVSRPDPMTVHWSAYAQSRTRRPVKGMLTGPVTMLQWSFVRDDIPRDQVCRQIALAIRDEVADLEAAGIAVIQVDEPAFREGLPLRKAAWDAYLAWASACFRIATGVVADKTSIHTHMCYAAFNDIMPAIASMDADAISIETTRSRMELLDAFASVKSGEASSYPAEIGPGVWDIHSPRVPSSGEMLELLRLARQRLEDWQIWVNPDCGLKTRSWEEVRPALANLVEAARTLRAES